MKILFTADWHIKVGQKNVPKQWQINRYKMLFAKINELAEKCDYVIIGGDIFDSVPNLNELHLFFIYLKSIKIPTILYDGNHEATKKGQTFLSIFKSIPHAYLNIVDSSTVFSQLDIDIIPYTELKTFNPEHFHSRILCTHVRGNIPPHVVSEIDLIKLNKWDIVLAGDLHAHSNSQRNILYPGSPLSTSFHRNPITNGVILFDTKNLDYEWVDLKLPQLIRKTISDPIEIIKTDYDHTIYELTGNLSDLSIVSTNNKLLEKKVLIKDSNASLDTAGLTMQQELVLYLRSILNIPESQIGGYIKIYNDYFEKTYME